MPTPTWEITKHLLNEFDGAATEIFVTDLPLSQLPVVMAVLGELPSLEVLSFGDNGLDSPEAFDLGWRSRIETALDQSCQHSLRSHNGAAHHLQVYLWVNAEVAALEVEFVFWNDLTFPKGLDSEERNRRLTDLVSMADACRAGVASARCIIAPEHNGPTAELIEERADAVVVW